jgi:basic membrane protein A
MRGLLLIATVLLATHGALLMVRPEGAGAVAPHRGGIDVGLVLDVGGLGDRSFNDASWAGAQRAAAELGARVHLIEPGDGADREAGLRLLAAQGMDLVIGVGFVFSDDLEALGREYPGVRFAGVDYALHTVDGRPVPPPSNVAALRFRDEQGAFLVGALAALVSGTGTVGFVGGMDIPLIRRFEAGYRQGAHQVCPSCTVLAQYAGVTPDAFRNPVRGKELALTQYQQGADVIFQAAGATGLGVFEAARETGHLVIGVDSDQHAEAPGRVLTSMIKGVDRVVYDQIRRVVRGEFHGGDFLYGVAEGGVGWVYDENNRDLVPAAAHDRVEALRADLAAGRVRVEVP